MESRQHSSGVLQNQNLALSRAVSGSAIGGQGGVINNTVKERCQSDGHNDTLPPKPPPAASTTGKTGLSKLGGLSRYLMEKAQSNDSGLDLSPATLQTLVHPLRSSNSSSSSLHVRSLFESPASSSEESPLSTKLPNAESSIEVPSASRSVLSEQSHNISETTVIEKTLTDDQSSKDLENISKKDHLAPIYENENGTKAATTKENYIGGNKTHHQPGYLQTSRTHPNPHDVTPKDRDFQIPYGVHHEKIRQRSSNSNRENTDPGVCPTPGGTRAYGCHQPKNNSLTNVATPIHSGPAAPAVAEHIRKSAMQTPKPKASKKKPSVPTSAKKPTGSGWKFLNEYVQNQEFLILEQLGKGGCGEVSLVMEKDTRKQFALKTVQLHGIDDSLVQECINEVTMLIDLKGTDLVVDIHNWEFNRSERTMKILMEKGQCDLNHTIYRANKTRKPIKLLKLKYIWESLLTIVQEIHSKGIVHADLKPANFVWFDDNLKIIDFGIASRLQSDLTSIAMPNPKGTLNFISPEIITQDASGRSKLSPKSDIWALGCILYLMVYGRTPFEHVTHPVAKMNAIVQGDIMYPHLPPHLISSEILSVLKLCFQTDYKLRPSATELLRHPFIHI